MQVLSTSAPICGAFATSLPLSRFMERHDTQSPCPSAKFEPGKPPCHATPPHTTDVAALNTPCHAYQHSGLALRSDMRTLMMPRKLPELIVSRVSEDAMESSYKLRWWRLRRQRMTCSCFPGICSIEIHCITLVHALESLSKD